MCDKRRHGVDESRRGGVDRVQSHHAGIDGVVDLRDGGRAELIESFLGGRLDLFFDFAFWHPASRRRMHQRESFIHGTGISSFVSFFTWKTTITWPKRRKHSPRDPSSHRRYNPSLGQSPPTRSWDRCACASRTTYDRRLSPDSGRGRSLPTRSLGSERGGL